MKKFLTKNLLVSIIVALSLVLRFAFLSHPAEVVFDEFHYGKFVSAYFSREYYFDVHPPLGKMLIAGFVKISGLKPHFFILRFLPALFGSLIPLLIYLLLKKMGVSVKAAFLGDFLAVFDNALLTQSKFILIDALLLVFGFSSLYFFLKQRKEEKNIKSLLFLAISAALATLSLSIKWTGLSFLGIIALVFLIDLFKKFNFKTAFVKLSVLILIPFIIYYFIFWLHFQILYKSGPGNAFMSSQFQKTLVGNNIKQNTFLLSDWQKFIELNKAMYRYNASLKASHPYSSKWYQWPISNKPIWYWSKTENGKAANIYLFGNPVIWWFVLAGIIFSVLAVWVKKIRQKLPPLFWVLFFGYFINLLPYIFIRRVTFLYYYLPSLIFGILILSILYEKIFAPFLKKTEPFFYFGFLFLCLFIFLILSPLNYGFFIPPEINNFYNIFIKFLS